MKCLKSATALLALGFVASACTTDDRLTPASNPSLSSVNQPVVQRTDYVLDLRSDGIGIGSDEKARLSDWFQSLQLGYGDRISADAPGSVSPAVRSDIADVAGGYGLLVSDGAPVTAGSIQPGMVRVVVSRTTASVPGCPQWEEYPNGARTSTSSNFGCAVNSNIAAMIADPNDLVLGRTGSQNGTADTATKAIRTYRLKEPTGAGDLKNETQDGNK